MALFVGLGVVTLSFGTPALSFAGEIVVPGPHVPTISAAIRLAASGDQLLIKAGVYRERLVIAKPLTLSAATGDDNQVIIDGEGQGRVVDIQAADVTLRGLVLRGSGDDIEQVDACVYIHNDAHRTQLFDNTMAQCLFSGPAGVIGEYHPRSVEAHLFRPWQRDQPVAGPQHARGTQRD